MFKVKASFFDGDLLVLFVITDYNETEHKLDGFTLFQDFEGNRMYYPNHVIASMEVL